jgi:hypothetical protein
MACGNRRKKCSAPESEPETCTNEHIRHGPADPAQPSFKIDLTLFAQNAGNDGYTQLDCESRAIVHVHARCTRFSAWLPPLPDLEDWSAHDSSS